MPGSDSFLNKPADELAEFLLRAARADTAPKAARERALQNAASAALGLGLLSGTAALGSRSTLLKGTSWLVAKWLAAGVSTGLFGIAVAQGVQQLAGEPATRPALAAQSAAEAIRARPNPLTVPLAAAENVPPLPEPEPESEPAKAPTSPPPAIAPAAASAGAPGPKSIISRPTSDGPAVASALANSKSSLTRELTLLEQVRSGLTGHAPGRALQALDQYQAEFPRGSLQIEAAALRVEAVGQTGNHALAQSLARAFLANFPGSPLCARVRAYSEVFVSEAEKP